MVKVTNVMEILPTAE